MNHKTPYTSKVDVGVFQNIKIEFLFLENNPIYAHHDTPRNLKYENRHQNHFS